MFKEPNETPISLYELDRITDLVVRLRLCSGSGSIGGSLDCTKDRLISCYNQSCLLHKELVATKGKDFIVPSCEAVGE